MSRPEYTWCVESANSITTCEGGRANNPTNDVDIPTNMPRLRTPVVQLYLGSVELPLSQYLIESLWNTVYFDEGLRIIVNNEADQCMREFTVIVNGDPITGVIPVLFNPIVDVDVTNPLAPIFTTQFDHALELRGQWDWGSPMKLVSTNLLDPALVNLTAANANLTILSNTEFQISNLPAPVAFTPQGGIYGHLYAPPIASPAKLASIVNAALQQVAPGEFSVQYNLTTGRFTFQSTITQTGTCVTNPPLAHAAITLSIPARNCLAALMGFGFGNVPVPTVPSPADCKVPLPCNVPTLEGGYGYQCFSQIHVTPGNYVADGLAAQLNMQWNRFTFDGGLTLDPLKRPTLVFSNTAGTAFVLAIEYGTYTPDTFADYLQSVMNAADPAGAYQVSWDIQTGQFCFTSTSDTVFGLEFNDAGQTLNPAILGFDYFSYRGKTQYCSTTSFQVPTTSCCGAATTRYTSYVYSTKVNYSQNKFCIEVNPPRTVIDGRLTANTPDGLGTLSGTVQAHGLQPDDLVKVYIPGGTPSGPYVVRVVEVVDAFSVKVEIGSVTQLVGAVNLAVSFGYADIVTPSLLWSDQQRPNRLYPRFLGYKDTDALYSGGMPVLVGPYSYDLEPSRSVLMIITDPNGATHTNHAWQTNNIANVFAKIVLYPQFRLERNVPMVMYLPDVKQITKMHFLFVNPEYHTPYQFHGKQWSCTINFVVVEAQSETKCF